MPFISTDTGWDRGSLSLPYSLYVFVYSALGIISGRLTDRLGPRVVLTVGGCLLGIGVMLVSRVHTLWHLYFALGLIAAAGMSAAYVPCNATVVRWFTLKRGLALSITLKFQSSSKIRFQDRRLDQLRATAARYLIRKPPVSAGTCKVSVGGPLASCRVGELPAPRAGSAPCPPASQPSWLERKATE